MITLGYLQERGLISDVLKLCDTETRVLCKASEFESKKDVGYCDSIVVIDGFRWVASDTPLADNPAIVYSSDGNSLCCWNRDEQKLIKKGIQDGMLVVTEVVKNNYKKENETMSDLNNLNLDDLGDVSIDNTLSNLEAFGEAPVATGSIVPKENFESANQKFFLHAKENGRFHAFVTKTPTAVKASKTSVKLLDANGCIQLDPDNPLTPEEQNTFDKSKKAPLSKILKEQVVTFREAKPGQIVGGIISYPAGIQSSVSFIDDVLAKKEVSFDPNNKEKVIKVLPYEQLLATIAAIFHGQIREDDTIMGKEASWLQISKKQIKKRKADADVTGTAQPAQYRPTLILRKDTATRKSMVTEKNYVPMAVYKTVSQQHLTAEEADGLNLHVESVIKNKGIYDALSDSTKADIKWDDANSEVRVSSEYFKTKGQCKPIVVPRYFDKTLTLTDVLIPVKTRKVNKKDPAKFTYSYVTYKLDDPENGPLANPNYRDVIEKSGLSLEVFAEEARKLTRRKSKKDDEDTSVDTYLSAMQGDINNKSMFEGAIIDSAELTKILKGIA